VHQWSVNSPFTLVGADQTVGEVLGRVSKNKMESGDKTEQSLA